MCVGEMLCAVVVCVLCACVRVGVCVLCACVLVLVCVGVCCCCVGVCCVCVCVCVGVCVAVCVSVCVSVFVVVWHAETSVCAFNTSPCVRSKCPRVYRQHAHMFFSCGHVAGTHWDVLNAHTQAC